MAETATEAATARTTEQQPPDPKTLEAEADAGPGAMVENRDQTMLATDTAKEKEMNNPTGPSSSEGSLAAEGKPAEEEKQGPPQEEEKKRSKAKIALVMSALMVRHTKRGLV